MKIYKGDRIFVKYFQVIFCVFLASKTMILFLPSMFKVTAKSIHYKIIIIIRNYIPILYIFFFFFFFFY